jgi:hypothetical protein
VNWLGAGIGSVALSLFGVTLGAILHLLARRHGIDFPPIVGLVAGIAAALASRNVGALRGLLVASLSVWAAAMAEVIAMPIQGLAGDLVRFHDRLGWAGLIAYAACAATGGFVGSRALRPGRNAAA